MNQISSFSIIISGIGDGVEKRDLEHFILKNTGIKPSSVTLDPILDVRYNDTDVIKRLLEQFGPLQLFEMVSYPFFGNFCHLANFAKFCHSSGTFYQHRLKT